MVVLKCILLISAPDAFFMPPPENRTDAGEMIILFLNTAKLKRFLKEFWTSCF
jgi:hypothetical protein